VNIKKLFTKEGLLNLLAVAGPIAAGVISGGVFTAPVLITAVSTLAAKLAQSLQEDIKKAKAKKVGNQEVDEEDPE
jgi:hypothetical protein